MKRKRRPSFKMRFGKYKGKTVSKIPRTYLEWAYREAHCLWTEEKRIIAQYIGKEYKIPERPPNDVAF